ncbi:haloacid dehalogenase [Marinithermofilum abyssi]|uniref:Haloacid dehalogenase n=1 Tax=Marinithermofilum abyssi TaxID=1571185 RepID=A0A8J2VDA0_9BACL|nr:TIGR01457 family HAD-type hydrolase [Marinithermofilum abyssi]GGE07068.1 haloacid dehalogenase [Marinithermofilum abyssi]
MKRYEGYLLDLDGTLYRGNEVIPGALEFVNKLKDSGKPYLFLTNNSFRTPEEVAAKLREFGYPAEADQVVTSSMAAAHYLKEEMNSPRVYAIGGNGLRTALKEAGCELTDRKPEAVVVGIDLDFTYEKMKKATLAIHEGARFIGTNGDLNLPTEEGLLPGNGSIIAGIQAATGVKPIFVGKPESVITEVALDKLQMNRDKLLMIGDNLMTDILTGVNAGMDTLLVYSGVTSPEDYEAADIKATHVIDDLRDWDI